MKKYIGIIIVAGLALGQQELAAQDFHFSQYYAAPQTLNPALTGNFYGQYRLGLNYRNQWNSIVNPYETMAASWDVPVKRWGIGGYMLNQQAGDADWSHWQGMLSASFDVPLGAQGLTHLVFGVQGGLIQESFTRSKLTFGDQYQPGGTLKGSGENVSGRAIRYPDMSAGILFYYGNPFARINPFIGATVFHPHEPDMSFSGSVESKLPRRELIHGGYRIKAGALGEITPHGFAMRQSEALEITPGLSYRHHLVTSDAYLTLGGLYRHEDAVIGHIGLQVMDILVGMSYDINTSSLSDNTNYRGGFELSLQYIRRKKELEPKFVCPRI